MRCNGWSTAALVVCLLVLFFGRSTAEEADAYDVDKASSSLHNSKLRGGQVADGVIAADDEEEGTFVEATLQSFAMIMVSELGDETFIIAAIMAMRHPRATILAGALGALYIMTVLSAALGLALPWLLSPDLTHKIATFMYFFFGFRLLYIAYHADAEEMQEEIDGVEKTIKAKKNIGAVRAFFTKVCTTVFIEAFVLTFLAEWGDRSQIATITLAAHNDPTGVIIGACVGHTICTSIAVLGGRMIASQISQKTVAVAGSFTFFVFAFFNLFQ
mmetsp:Transcript_6963/g.12272  ORF Transcript_6963/g.12272 Transcript_6963/m.12272 type:complete len:273 (+) Transcript_6963:190-1008(+)